MHSSQDFPALHILVAENDVITRLCLGEYLRACGHAVVEAANGAEAMAVLQSGRGFDVLFCDAQLEGEASGFALAQWVRRYRAQMKVILAGSLNAKVDAAGELCGPAQDSETPAALLERIRRMRAKRARAARRSASVKKIAS